MALPPGPHSDAEFSALYEELREVARRALAREGAHHPLDPTALVHEAYLRLGPTGLGTFDGRGHFLAVAATAMRRVLVDHARARNAAKRGGDWVRIDLDEQILHRGQGPEQTLAIDSALERLAGIDPRVAAIVEMRFFSGMTEAEVAEELGMSERWVRKQWASARTWLREELAE